MKRTLSALLVEGKRRLRASGAGEYALDAELLMMKTMEFDRVQLFTKDATILSEAQEETYLAYLARREQGEPLQYITGECEFMALPFRVQPGVLIPRPDTELLVETVLARIFADAPCRILDMGTGSGCIAVSLAAYRKKAEVTAVDISRDALAVARENAERNGVSERISFLSGDLFSALADTPPCAFDWIVSNPPYIADGVIPTLMREVRAFEPMTALSGGADGLAFYRRIIEAAPAYLKPGGGLAFEIGYDQGEAVRRLLLEKGFQGVGVYKDLAGLDRVAMGTKQDFT